MEEEHQEDAMTTPVRGSITKEGMVTTNKAEQVNVPTRIEEDQDYLNPTHASVEGSMDTSLEIALLECTWLQEMLRDNTNTFCMLLSGTEYVISLWAPAQKSPAWHWNGLMKQTTWARQ